MNQKKFQASLKLQSLTKVAYYFYLKDFMNALKQYMNNPSDLNKSIVTSAHRTFMKYTVIGYSPFIRDALGKIQPLIEEFNMQSCANPTVYAKYIQNQLDMLWDKMGMQQLEECVIVH
jgi:hypothetical protein